MKKVIVASVSLLAISQFTMATKYAFNAETAQSQAVEFAPGIISTKQFEINTVLNKAGDKVIFSRCSNDFKHCTMMESSLKNNQWQAPIALPFSGQYLDADPYFNEDFTYLYYISKRPIKAGNEATETVNLWRTELKGGQWQTPEYLSELSSAADDLYPSVASNGDLYFPSFRDNKRQLFVATKRGNGFNKPKALPTEMFGEGAKIGDSVVLADGNTIIFSMRRDDSLGKGDLYVSFKRNGKWTLAKSLGDKVNTADHEFTPIVSPDGKYLFFTRIENGVGNLYQIATSAIGL